MRKILCKIWNFVLMLFGDIVNVVIEAVKAVAELFIDVFRLVAETVVDIVGSTGIGTWLKMGLIAWGAITLIGLLSDDEDEKDDEEGSGSLVI